MAVVLTIVVAVVTNISKNDLNNRFPDLKQVNFPIWVMLPALVDLSHVSMQYQEELREKRNS